MIFDSTLKFKCQLQKRLRHKPMRGGSGFDQQAAAPALSNERRYWLWPMRGGSGFDQREAAPALTNERRLRLWAMRGGTGSDQWEAAPFQLSHESFLQNHKRILNIVVTLMLQISEGPQMQNCAFCTNKNILFCKKSIVFCKHCIWTLFWTEKKWKLIEVQVLLSYKNICHNIGALLFSNNDRVILFYKNVQ